MTATYRDIKGWLSVAKENGSRYLIVGLDPFDWDNFPIYIPEGKDPNDRIDELIRTGNRWDECYDMKMDIQSQLSERRARHLPPRKE
jgi:hypothetical protein